MAKTITASSGGWTVTMSVPNTITRDDWLTAQDSIWNVLSELYAAQLRGDITLEERQVRVDALTLLNVALNAEYDADSLPDIIWTH